MSSGFDWENNDDPYSFGVDSSGNAPDPTDFSGGGSSGFNMGTVATGLKGLGSVFSAFGFLQQGKQIAGADEYNAQLAIQSGEIQIQDLDTAGEMVMSTQKAMYSKAGVALTGSPLDTMLESATNVERDKQIVNYNVQSKVNMLRYQGDVAKYESKMKAGSALLSGAGSMLGLG